MFNLLTYLDAQLSKFSTQQPKNLLLEAPSQSLKILDFRNHRTSPLPFLYVLILLLLFFFLLLPPPFPPNLLLDS